MTAKLGNIAGSQTELALEGVGQMGTGGRGASETGFFPMGQTGAEDYGRHPSEVAPCLTG